MGSISTILLYFFISKISAYSVKRLTDDIIYDVGFDGKGNIYALGTPNGLDFRLQKSNPLNEKLANVPLDVPRVRDMLVSSEGDAFLLTDTDFHWHFGVIRSNSNRIDEIESYGSIFLFYLDNNDNFFYSKRKGIRVVRPDSTASVPIENLEDFRPVAYNKVMSDKCGNIYMAVGKSTHSPHSLALITKESLKSNYPSATFIDALEQVSEQSMEDMKIDEENTLWMTVRSPWTDEGQIKKYSNGTLRTIHSDRVQSKMKMVQAKERIYIIARSPNNSMKSIYYVNPTNEIVEMPELKTLSGGWFDIHGLSDSEENSYFYTNSYEGNYELTSSLGSIITIKSNGTEPIPITWETSTNISDVKVDFNDDIWIAAESGDIYYLKKEETVPVLVDDFKDIDIIEDIHFNFATKKIYLLAFSGLHIVENN